jgi:hypothetical protein
MRGALASLWLVALVAASPAAGGAAPPSVGIASLLVFDANVASVVNLEEGVPVSGPGALRIDAFGSLPGSLVVSFDPDPRVSYELAIENTTGAPIQGALVLEVPIVPVAGSPPGHARLDAQADDPGGALSMTAQHLPILVEDVGPTGRDTFLAALVLSANTANTTLLRQTAGPETVPRARSGQYDRFAVQLSFSLAAGDTGFFGGSASLPDPLGGCDDYLDNDADGRADHAGGDPGCDSSWDSTERALDHACDDGFDQDGDGWSDVPFDPGCRDAASATESPACQDGLDNDGDGNVDFDGGLAAGVPAALRTAPDAECSEAGQLVGWKDREHALRSGVGCGLGPELVPILALVGFVQRRRTSRS